MEDKHSDDNNRFRILFDNMQDAFALHEIVLDPHGIPVDYIFLEVNGAFEEMTGLKSEDILGRKVTEILPGIEGDPADWIGQYSDVALYGKHLCFEQYSQDLKKWFSLNAYSPKHGQFVVLFHDITSYVKMQERLAQSEKLSAIGQLAGGVAHDFNNQLGAMLCYADLIKSTPGCNEEIAEYVDNIAICIKRSADLTSQLLTFARKANLKLDPVDIHKIIKETVAILLRTFDKKIVIELDLTAESSVVCGENSQLENAFLNLAINARDVMPEGGVLTFKSNVVTFTEETCKLKSFDLIPGKYLEVCVSDTGDGIDPEVMTHMFEPFYTTKQDRGGTGMGLAVVYGTIKGCQGYIDVESSCGKGTTFYLYFNLLENSVCHEENLDLADEAIVGSGHILVVDDEKMLRDVTADMLVNLGYSVTAKENGADAVEYYKSECSNVDLVILDLIMPLKSGKDAFIEMREINPEIAAIFISGYNFDENILNIVNDTTICYIQKPFGKKELAEKISKVLSAKKQ